MTMPNDTASPRSPFSYEAAFGRNLGWVTEGEQQTLRQNCVRLPAWAGSAAPIS